MTPKTQNPKVPKLQAKMREEQRLSFLRRKATQCDMALREARIALTDLGMDSVANDLRPIIEEVEEQRKALQTQTIEVMLDKEDE